MSTTRFRIDPDDLSTLPEGRIDPARVDAHDDPTLLIQRRPARFFGLRRAAIVLPRLH